MLWTIGDSWTDPADGNQRGLMAVGGWAELVAARLGLGLCNPASGGAGYATWNGVPTCFPAQVVRAPCPTASVAVVFGSVNDYLTGQPPALVGAQAEATLRAIGRTAPDAALLVVGPQWWHTLPEPGMYPLRDAVADAAAAVGALFLDPLGWFQGRPELIGPDGGHPNAAGHQHLADQLTPVIDGLRLGRLVPPTLLPPPPAVPGLEHPLGFPMDYEDEVL